MIFRRVTTQRKRSEKATSKVKNEPKKESVDPTSFAQKAISRSRHIHGKNLVRKGNQKAGCTEKEIAFSCDTAMCGDHRIGKMYDSVLELPKCIAKGDEICALRYKKTNLK